MKLTTHQTAHRVLGFPVLCALVAGNMIGSGIFLLPAALAPFGGYSLIAWLVTSFGAMLLAFIFATLSRALPKEGGPYAYCREAFGDFMGFQIAYNYWIAVVVANVATLVTMVAYLSIFWPILAQKPLYALGVAVGTMWIITGINLWGVGKAGYTQLVLTIMKIIPLVILIVIGFPNVHWNYFFQTAGNHPAAFSAIAGASSLTIWAFTGLESATIPAAFTHHPERTIPRATLYGTLIASLVYIFSSIVVMGLLPPAQLAASNAPFADIAFPLLGHAGAYLVAFVAALSCFSTTVGWALLQGQVPMAAASDGLFPAMFAKVDRKGTPVVGLIVSTVIASLLFCLNYQASLVEQFTLMVKCSTLAFLIPYLYTTIAKLILFVKHPLRFAGQRPWLTIVTALIAYFCVFFAIFGLGKELIYYGSLLFFTGIPLYVWVKYREPEKHQGILREV